MSFVTVAQGSLINFFLNCLVPFILISYKFEISYDVFTLILVIILLLVTTRAGYKVERFPEVHGFFIGIVSSVIILLYIGQFVVMNWEMNFLLITVWSFIGFIGSFIGAKINGTKKAEKPMIEN